MSVKTAISLDRQSCEQIAKSLSHLLADTYVTYTKTQNFHWNIVDSRFFFLHEFFEKNYKELAEGIDELAERIRKLNLKSPGSLKDFLELTSLEEAEFNQDYSGDEMIQELCRDREIIIKHIRSMIEEASKLNDEGTADLLIQQLREHEKAVWMLRSHLVDNF